MTLNFPNSGWLGPYIAHNWTAYKIDFETIKKKGRNVAREFTNDHVQEAFDQFKLAFRNTIDLHCELCWIKGSLPIESE